ncbi:winged helix-turn-helix domain-containing protein [Solwaraspora sp. WMMD1047]|uniref:winged helix-turn-helix domain-containing protein n=1 Tax=Solwaraspora sp. WMMD1047 TaxID=3016102 RepID=UPI0024178742|nr:winged helix-turn-helix domain-containing protein [Solwaraspora sp. WMMD1047]MDG4831253.1 winged helix-turn-helix domain-containing protein [Solwaraspora sp. WMMD1047]
MTVTVISPRTHPATVRRRPQPDQPSGRVPGAGPEPAPPTLRILTASRRVLRDGVALVLTRLEFDLLRFLAQHPRRVFTRLQLLNQVWGYEHALVRTVDVHVRRLRAKVGDALPVVTTVYGVGYRLADGVRVVVEPDN